MGPEIRRKGALTVALDIEMIFEHFFNKKVTLWKSVHSTPDFNIDKAIGVHFCGETVLFDSGSLGGCKHF